MTNIESKQATVAASAEELFRFLSDMNNFARLLPENKIENVQTTETTCSFRISGMADIQLEKKSETPFQLIQIESGDKPFKFYLQIPIQAISEKQSQASLRFEGQLNPMLQMMVTGPLTNFFNMLADNLEKQFQA